MKLSTENRAVLTLGSKKKIEKKTFSRMGMNMRVKKEKMVMRETTMATTMTMNTRSKGTVKMIQQKIRKFKKQIVIRKANKVKMYKNLNTQKKNKMINMTKKMRT